MEISATMPMKNMCELQSTVRIQVDCSLLSTGIVLLVMGSLAHCAYPLIALNTTYLHFSL